MLDKRLEARLLCSDMVDVQWRDKGGRNRRRVANLEDISLSGACLQVDLPIPLKTTIRIGVPKGELIGTVRYCVFREIGYFLGIEFNADSRWSQHRYMPQHLLDPSRLVLRAVHRVKSDPDRYIN